MIPKVLVFTITYEGKDYCFDKFNYQMSKLSYPKESYRHIWIDNSQSMDYYNKLKNMGLEVYHVERGNTSREALARSQNFARRMALEEGYDYLLSVESDLLGVPHNIIQHLIGNAKEMVGCLYLIGDERGRLPCVTIAELKEEVGLVGTRLIYADEGKQMIDNPGLYAVNSCGLGCTLISREVFEKVQFMYHPDLRSHSDVFFANDVWKNGFRIYVDSSILLDHKNVPWSGVDDR